MNDNTKPELTVNGGGEEDDHPITTILFDVSTKQQIEIERLQARIATLEAALAASKEREAGLVKLCLRAASSIDLLMIDVDDIPIVNELRTASALKVAGEGEQS